MRDDATSAPRDPESSTLDRAAAEFPIKRECVYLNTASIGPCAERVTDAVASFMADVRDHGRRHYPAWCRRADLEIKPRIAGLVGARASEIAFVPNTTHGLSIVANGLDWRDGDNVVVADIEYPSNVYPWLNLRPRGVSVRWVQAVDGRVRVEDVERAIDGRTRVVSLSSVQFSNGFRLDLAALSEVCRRRRVLLNLDAIQGLGAMHMDLSRLQVDFLAAGGHKWLLGPIGTGVFYCRMESMERLRPPTVGYHSVDAPIDHGDFALTLRPDAGRFEEALVNFPGIWGLDASIRMLDGIGTERIEAHVLDLAALAVEGLRSRGYAIVSPTGANERSGIVAFRHPSLASASVESRLVDAGVYLAVRRGALRLSPALFNDAGEIEAMLDALP